MLIKYKKSQNCRHVYILPTPFGTGLALLNIKVTSLLAFRYPAVTFLQRYSYSYTRTRDLVPPLLCPNCPLTTEGCLRACVYDCTGPPAGAQGSPAGAQGSATEIDGNTLSLCIQEPLGVVGQIIPWNFPLLMAVGGPARMASLR